MKSIWKWGLSLGTNTVQMPEGTTILSFGNQLEKPTIWGEVDVDQEREDRVFVIVGTGHEIPDNGLYLGTAQFMEGALVWHLYELRVGGF